MSQNKALIALSGGVDSSVAAHLMQASGYHCVGATARFLPHFDPLTKQTQYLQKYPHYLV